MDSYLANIDTYMKQQQQQEMLKRQREQQLLQQQHLQQQRQNIGLQPSQQMNDDWLRNMSNLSVAPDTAPLYSNPTLYMNAPANAAFNPHVMSNNYAIPPPVNYLQPTQPPEGFDINGQPIRIRKKPGRKPNPASPALRKAQNRAAQRAFRERKERHLKDLETTIRNLREQRNNATRELNALKGNLESYKAENWYLKGVVLTLQFICMHHNINIPTHSPYLSEDALAKMAQTAPHAIEAYVNSYTRNNFNLKSTMSYHFVDKDQQDREPSATESPHPYEEEHDESMDYNEHSDDEFDSYSSPPPPPPQLQKQETIKQEDNNRLDWLNKLQDEPVKEMSSQPPASSLDAIQQIRLKLGVQSTLNNADDQAAARLKPTILQLAIPHDPRIDLVPTPHMRDRMIIFRDQMDYDRCFTMMLNEAVYHGGDPTMSESWELPADFFSEFWYLTIDYDIKKTNKWRRKKGLSDVAPGPQQQDTTRSINWPTMMQQGGAMGEFWNDEDFDQIVKGMPSLQPMNQQGYPLSPPSKLAPMTPNSPYSDSPKSMYSRLMSAPESRQRIQSPSLENMIELINRDLEEN
ncbi:uncharacterized protein EV154DRAFT_439194 [Mucor mucedo]|uniref:uncharacterized protein n=1 Tax=Mucor mucedo TaxID=29922 RepID=UPI00221E92BE|nr:uncharacterized protein EV154DRAFT_439194 [Mucor mucedo]KAI7893878.1 hypothetical protein EV154DRAFT_439194 [Mucor mucedo]